MNDCIKVRYLLLPVIVELIIVVATGYVGDIPYYISVKDGILRNIIIQLITVPLYMISRDPVITMILYIVIMFFIYYYIRSSVKSLYAPLFIVLSPYIMICTKDSLVILAAIIGAICNFKQYCKFRTTLWFVFLFFICLIRPQYTIAAAIILCNSCMRRGKHFIYATAFGVLAYIGIFNFDSINRILDEFITYPIQYFESYTQAGTTDYRFIYEFYGMNAYEKIYTIINRTIFPFWMLRIDEVSSKLYFIIYVFSILFPCYITAKSNLHRKYKLTLYLCIIISLFMFGAIVVSNAGSSARYISSFPFVMLYLFSFEYFNQSYLMRQ